MVKTMKNIMMVADFLDDHVMKCRQTIKGAAVALDHKLSYDSYSNSLYS